MKLKERIREIVEPAKGENWPSRVFDWMITTLILASVVSVFVVTFEGLPRGVKVALAVLEIVASVVFTVEYALRIWIAEKKLKYIFSPMAIIDLLAILPFYLPMFLPHAMLGIRALRLVRLLRIVKLNRYFDALRSIGEVFVAKKRELLGSFFFVILLMLVSSLLMYSVEHEAQPEVFKNAFSGLWWAVATLTTVGYGDIYPVTVAGRLLGALIAFSGIAALAIPTGIMTAGLTERLDKSAEAELERQRQKDDEHDRLLREQAELLKTIADRLAKLEYADSRNGI